MDFGSVNEQVTYETQALEEGKLRYLRQQKRLEEDQGFSSRSDIGRIIKGCLPEVSKAISRYLESASNEGQGRSPDAYGYLQPLDVDQLALIGLSCVFNVVSREGTVTEACVGIGKAVEAELWAKGLQDRDEKLLDRLVKRAMKTHGSVAYRRKAIRATALKEGYSVDPLPNDERAKIGAPVVSAVLEGCPEVFELFDRYGPKSKTESRIGLTKEASAYLTEITEALAWMHPMFKPMLVPPKPWVAFDTGCYLSEPLRRQVPLVRVQHKEHKALIKEAIRSGVMQPCLLALNAIQETPWRINQRMLEVVKWAYEQGLEIKKFPQRNHIMRPNRPDNWESLSDNERKAWRIRVSQIAQRNRGIDGERVVVLQDFAVAEELSCRERFFIPHSLDFRGRVYPVPHFNQQRASHIKSLLEFADGVRVGDDGAYFLAIHVANCGDFDKVSKRSFDERVQWTIENEELIRRVADDPQGTYDVWKNADKPFEFVAACIDYAGFLQQGYGYVSHLPIALDGSNSGLQHYSAALRSPEGALVNLVPSDVPSDVYQAVCDRVIQIVERDALNGDEVAQIVRKNGVTRSLVKRNVMTFAYSSEQYGFADQQRVDLMEPLAMKVLEAKLIEHPYGKDNGFKASLYIAKAVWTAVTEIVKDASEGMKFFQKCAAALAHERKGVMWMTPVGLPVLHKYTDYDVKRVQLFLYDKGVPVTEAKPYDKIEGDSVLKRIQANIRVKPSEHIRKEKAKSAIAPNVIHSMDSAHLMMVVLDAKEKGINHFSLIHDSFGTHAGNTPEFFYTIREQFVNMYENYCPFEEIAYHTGKALDDKTKVPQTPTKGSLDLNGVIQSLYAFA